MISSIPMNTICAVVWYKVVVVKLATLIEGDPKAPFSIAVGEGATPFPGLLHFNLYT